MKRDEVLQKLQSIKSQGFQILDLLEATPRTSLHEADIRKLTARLRVELETEYAQTLPERVQKSMSIFELSVYSPTIEETWKGTGIRRLKIDGPINEKWRETLEAVVYKVTKYLP
ncbi:MAG TPA: hypothetical protein VK638_33425 [Edaphobacter sp.]|nr:hypothetical protein [Edaphobacter sp.]